MAVWLTGYLHDQGLMSQGARDATLKGLEASTKEVEAARFARMRVRTELNADPSKLRDDDGFKRRDGEG